MDGFVFSEFCRSSMGSILTYATSVWCYNGGEILNILSVEFK